MGLAGGRVSHQFQIAVVGSDDQRAARFAHRVSDRTNGHVHRLCGQDRRLQVAAVADHVRVGDIADDHIEATRANRIHQLAGQLGKTHRGLQVIGGDLGAWNQDAFLANERIFAATAHAVSYTHLDVYKRQVEATAGRS